VCTDTRYPCVGVGIDDSDKCRTGVYPTSPRKREGEYMLGDIKKKIGKKKSPEKNDIQLLSNKDVVRFALFCARQVEDDWKGIPECKAAIEVAERWLEGKATKEECKDAAYAAYAAAAYAAAAYAAANAAANAAYAAVNTYAAANAANAANAADANKEKTVGEQWEYYNELLHFDEIAEKALLGG